ncbi:MAG: phage baseplate assembly protein V [Pseudomonadales bacterium]|nr:phage baseplate assembly protein V [Pseudomonadales bacterium]
MSVLDQMEQRISQLERRVKRMLEVGLVVEADYTEQVKLRVEISDRITDWIPWLTVRAGGDRSWWPPEVGEQVMVLAPNGDAVAAVALAGLYSSAAAAPAASVDVRRTVMGDGAVIDYDRALHVLTVQIPGDVIVQSQGDVAVTAAGVATVDAPQIRLNGGTGCITQESICHFTGVPHGDGSATVKVGKQASE